MSNKMYNAENKKTNIYNMNIIIGTYFISSLAESNENQYRKNSRYYNKCFHNRISNYL